MITLLIVKLRTRMDKDRWNEDSVICILIGELACWACLAFITEKFITHLT